jgi:hypothetical protein
MSLSYCRWRRSLLHCRERGAPHPRNRSGGTRRPRSERLRMRRRGTSLPYCRQRSAPLPRNRRGGTRHPRNQRLGVRRRGMSLLYCRQRGASLPRNRSGGTRRPRNQRLGMRRRGMSLPYCRRRSTLLPRNRSGGTRRPRNQRLGMRHRGMSLQYCRQRGTRLPRNQRLGLSPTCRGQVDTQPLQNGPVGMRTRLCMPLPHSRRRGTHLSQHRQHQVTRRRPRPTLTPPTPQGSNQPPRRILRPYRLDAVRIQHRSMQDRCTPHGERSPSTDYQR